MKKKYIILICCILYIAASIGIWNAVDNYINRKVIRLRDVAIENLESFFANKPMYVDLLYGPYGCNYTEAQIPGPEEPDISSVLNYIKRIDPTLSYEEAKNRIRQNLKNAWEKRYGDWRKLYDLDIFPTEDNSSLRAGWALKVIRKQENSFNNRILSYLLFPKQVAYKNISPLLYGGVPSVETAIQEALYFTTKNEKSYLQPYYERGSTYNLISKMQSAVDNEYYSLTEEPEGTFFFSDDIYSKPSSVESGGMQNGYYNVIYYHKTQPVTYSIQFRGNTKSDKYRLAAIYIGLLTLIMSGLVIFIVKKRD